VREVLLREGADRRATFCAAIEKAGPAPVRRLQQVVPARSAWFHGGRFYGCSFMSASAERAKGDPDLRRMAAKHPRHLLDFFTSLATEAGVAEPQMLARHILPTIDGSIAALMVAGDEAILSIATCNLHLIIAQAGTSHVMNPNKV
jgi:hypothetical protein